MIITEPQVELKKRAHLANEITKDQYYSDMILDRVRAYHAGMINHAEFIHGMDDILQLAQTDHERFPDDDCDCHACYTAFAPCGVY